MKLVRGAGSESTGACWMSALHLYTRKDRSWTDTAPWACVSPVIARLCIGLNDRLDDGDREALVGPHLFAPLGTKTGRADDVVRARLCAEQARAWADWAKSLKGRGAAAYAAYAASSAAAAASNASNAADAAYAASYAADAASNAAYAAYAASNAAYAAYAASNAADARRRARARIHREWLDLILRCCAVGKPVEVQEACSREAVMEMLCRP